MSLPWIRLYSSLNRNPKWLSLPLNARSIWCSLLMLAGDEDRNGDVSEVALATRMGVEGRALARALTLFEQRGWIARTMLETGERVVRVLQWSCRQYPSDLSKLRQAKYRKARAIAVESDGHSNVTGDVTVTVQTQSADSDSDAEISTPQPPALRAGGVSSFTPIAVESLKEWAAFMEGIEDYDPLPRDIKKVAAEIERGWTLERIVTLLYGAQVADHGSARPSLARLLRSSKASEWEADGRRIQARIAETDKEESRLLKLLAACDLDDSQRAVVRLAAQGAAAQRDAYWTVQGWLKDAVDTKEASA